MRAKDRAERIRERLLGRAIGPGIFEGLFVSRGQPDGDGVVKTLGLTAGAAINGVGDVLVLPRDITVDVVPPTTPQETQPSLFKRCEPAAPATVPSQFGIYVLAMSPASAYRERAPKSGLGTEGVVTGCGDAFAVDGVQFRMEKLDPETISGIDAAARDELRQLIGAAASAASRSLLRNLVAHYCFGTPELGRFPADPLARSNGASAWLTYGALDDLRGLERLTACDVPVALLLWTAAGVAFVDAWSARRPPLEGGGSPDWPFATGERRAAVGVARFLQFQTHLAELVAPGGAVPADARSAFRYLPPAGVLPLADAGSPGFDRARFFVGCTTRRPVFMNGARLLHLLDGSFAFPPIDLRTLPRTGGTELIWLYRLYENAAVLDRVLPGNADREVIVFANGNLPFFAESRFDVARFDYSNFSPRSGY
jgi:hypothetical protein